MIRAMYVMILLAGVTLLAVALCPLPAPPALVPHVPVLLAGAAARVLQIIGAAYPLRGKRR